MHRQITARSQSSVSGTYIGELLDILGPSSAEHESLTIRANLADDFSNLRLETHIKHTISFIHNEIGYSTEVSFMSLKHVDKTTGGSDHDLDTALEVTDLGTLGRTAVDSSVTDAGVGTSENFYQDGPYIHQIKAHTQIYGTLAGFEQQAHAWAQE